jgi:Putative zinc-finger
MTPPEEHHRYRDQIGAFVLGKLDGEERTAMQAHLNSCPVCQAEVKELEPVVAALADADPDRIDEEPWPPGDLEELTLAPILGEIQRARRRSRGFRWSALAAAAICVVAIGLAGLAWPLEPALSLESHLQERLSFSGEAPSMEVEGNLIAHARGTEIRLIVSGMRDGQTHRVTLVSEDGERVNAGTFIGVGEKPLSLHLNAALLREDADELEVRTPGGELVCFDNLPEQPRVALFGIFPWPDQDPQNESTGPSAEDPPPPDTPEKPKDDGSGSGTPHKGSSPESNDKGSSSGGEKPRSAPESSEPGRGPHEPPPPEQSPPCDQYKCQP